VTFPLVATLILMLPVTVLAAVIGLVRLIGKRPQRAYWRAVGWVHAALLPVVSFAVLPGFFGWYGSRHVGTRPHERTYAGPRIDRDGRLLVQSWDSLMAEAGGAPPQAGADVIAAAKARERRIPSTDGVTLRAFRIEAKSEPPVAVVVLVHGLFRPAMEPEPIAALLREQGCECWLLELRNFGGSGRAPFTGGLRESDDVVAAVEFVRAQRGRASTPVVLGGVSFGTVAIAYALPRLSGIAGVVLDSPIDDLLAAGNRMLTREHVEEGRRALYLAEPWRSLTFRALGAWSGFRIEDVAPGDVLATLPHDLPVLMIGAGDDDKAPPDTVERLFTRLPTVPERKRLWIEPGIGHGRAFLDRPATYAEQLAWLLAHLRAS
jgi:alpha-beta hydrolase superfamily lysophospholipase